MTRGLSVTEARQLHFRLLDEEWAALSAAETESVSCPVGCSRQPETVFVKHGTVFVRCPDCGLVFINPQLTEAALTQHFTHSPAWEVWARDVLPSPEQLAFDAEKYGKALDQLAAVVPAGGQLLDVGANSGVFLSLARARGWTVSGVEPSEAACRVARDVNGVDLFCGTFDQFQAPAKSFDLITFWASLEYGKHPDRSVAKALDLLKPGGALLIFISGNAHSLVMRALRERCVGFLFNRSWYFSPDSLDALVMRRSQAQVTLVERHSVIPSVDVLARALDYMPDPYAGPIPAVLDDIELQALCRFIERRHMGYKFQSVYKVAE